MLKRAHIVKSVRKLDKNNSDILCHSKKHLTQVLRLHIDLFLSLVTHIAVGMKLQSSQLCNTVNQERNIGSETLFYLLFGKYGIFNDVMKQARSYSLFVHFKICQNYGNTKRVNYIWFTRFSKLLLMSLSRFLIRLFN